MARPSPLSEAALFRLAPQQIKTAGRKESPQRCVPACTAVCSCAQKGQRRNKGPRRLLVTWVSSSSPDVSSLTQMSSVSAAQCVCVCVCMVNWVEKKTDLGHAAPMSTSGRSADVSDVGERGGGGGERACSQTAERPGVRGGQNQCTMTHLSPRTLAPHSAASTHPCCHL